MYPKNAVSPPRIAVGSIYLIADGTLQTSGASIAVRAEGGAEGAGGGTTAYGASGTIYYTPTQAETNYTAFCVTAYKASCTSVSVTVVTTAVATPGQVALGGILGTALSETSAGYLAAAFKKLFDVATPLLVASDVMRGTDSAALASVVGALADAAADGDPTSADTLMQYVKQLINTLVGTAGIPTFPAEAAPGNAVSLAEVIRAIHADVTGLNGSAMADVSTLATAAKLLAYIQLLARSDAAIATDNATELAEINANEGSGAGDFSNQTDAPEALRDRGDAAWIAATGFSTHSAADVWAVVARTLTANTNFNDPTAATIASQVRTELTTELARIDAAITTRSTYAGADTAGTTTLLSRCAEARLAELDAENLPADVAAVKSDTAAILLDTGTDGVVVVSGSKTGYALSATGADLITSASTFGAAMADAVLKRSVATVEATSAEWSLCTVILAMLESSISGTTWTIKRTDGSTTHATKTVTVDAAADPVTGVS